MIFQRRTRLFLSTSAATRPKPRQCQHQIGKEDQIGATPPNKNTIQNGKTFYRRSLPPSLISFTSPNGKQLFRDSLHSGYAENYFSLVGNFTTQSEPAFCGLGSLAMVLNAFELDPGKQWKGAWRWYADDNLECLASSVESIKSRGITFREFSCLAKCNGLTVISKRGDSISKQEFEYDLKKVCSSTDLHMVVSFSRGTLGQTGDGHFSPIGSYHPQNNMALILDTARFKYPSYFAPVDLLFEAMKPIDKTTGLPRGYFILSKPSSVEPYSLDCSTPLNLCKLTRPIGISNPKLTNLFCLEIPSRLAHLGSISQDFSLLNVMEAIFTTIPFEYRSLVKMNDSNAIVDLVDPLRRDCEVREHSRSLERLVDDVKLTHIYDIVSNAISYNRCLNQSQCNHYDNDQVSVALSTIFVLSLPPESFRTLPPRLISSYHVLKNEACQKSPLLRGEVERISSQLVTLMNTYCNCLQNDPTLNIRTQSLPCDDQINRK